jgi:beta-lactam-binding protein with PASTA domain
MTESGHGGAARDERGGPEVSEGEPPPGTDAPARAGAREPAAPIAIDNIEPDPADPEGKAELVQPAAPRRRVSMRRRFRGMLFLGGVALAAFATGLFIFNNAIMPRLIHSAGEVRVPDLTNLTLEQGEKAVQPLGLALSRAGERFDPSVPRGFILSQDPPPEALVRGKKRILVVVSLGEEFSSVPSLFGESVRTAKYLLERAGLRVGAITRAPSEDVGEGLVVATDPPAESVLGRNTPVSLLVSVGAGVERFVMPDLIGREISGARRQLEALGFKVFTPPAAPSHGTIVVQDPPPGASITRTTTIMLQATGRVIR